MLVDSFDLIKFLTSIDSIINAVNQKELTLIGKIIILKNVETSLVECRNQPEIKKTMQDEINYGFEIIYHEIIQTYITYINLKRSQNEKVNSNMKEELAQYQEKMIMLKKGNYCL